MDETEHMPRYTLTLVDSTGAMEPLILMDDDLKSIAAKLEGRVSAKTRGRLPRGTGGISATPKGYRAYSTVTDPLTGKDTVCLASDAHARRPRRDSRRSWPSSTAPTASATSGRPPWPNGWTTG